MNTKYRRLKVGDKRPKGYEYRYEDARGWTPWLAGDDEYVGQKIMGNGAQFRGPVKPTVKATGLCSAHQTPEPACPICYPTR